MSYVAAQVEERPVNWLPVPGEEFQAPRRQADVDEGDLFAKGEVTTFQTRQGEGFLRNDRGDIIPFSISESRLLGDPEYLEVGVRVGYDASVTPHGMKVTVLKIY